MPLFEYKCDDCGTEFEELTSGRDEKMACPECKSINTRKLLSIFGTSRGSSGVPAVCRHQSGSCDRFT